jgi:hypothetical protein
VKHLKMFMMIWVIIGLMCVSGLSLMGAIVTGVDLWLHHHSAVRCAGPDLISSHVDVDARLVAAMVHECMRETYGPAGY